MWLELSQVNNEQVQEDRRKGLLLQPISNSQEAVPAQSSHAKRAPTTQGIGSGCSSKDRGVPQLPCHHCAYRQASNMLIQGQVIKSERTELAYIVIYLAGTLPGERQLWSGKYAPPKLDDLVVQKKKIADVRTWLELQKGLGSIASHGRLLLLSGMPCSLGSGLYRKAI